MIAQYFLAEMEKDGYRCQLNGDKLFFPPLEMELAFEHIYTKDNASCIKVSVAHPKLLPNGLHELAFGYGDEEDARFKFAAAGWMQTDFPVIHSYLCPTGNDLGTKRMELVSQTGNEQLGWNVLLGPIMTMGDHLNVNEDSMHELFVQLMNEITGELREPGILFLKCFLSKSGDESIDADCRLQGEDWLIGTNRLFHFAEQLKTNGKFHSRKQFIILYTRPLSELKKSKDLAKDVKAKHEELYGRKTSQDEKKWYEFWR